MRKYFRYTCLSVLFLAAAIGFLHSRPAISAGGKGYITVDTLQFMQMMKHKDFTLINVHVPYQGEIPGTDERLPYDRITALKNKLPQDKISPIVVYCMGSYMGRIAARTLSAMGYTHVTQFYDGMIGWQDHGGKLIYKSK
jgi:rhodanese-related sulfurtransferase